MQSVEAPRRREMETENVLGFNIETERERACERRFSTAVCSRDHEDKDDDDDNDDVEDDNDDIFARWV